MNATKIALALHTTTETLEVAVVPVFKEGAFNTSSTRQNEWLLGRELSNQIHSCLADFMQVYSWQDLEFIAIASGIGSYTSTRIGMVLARTLGEQLSIPIYAIACSDIETQVEISKSPKCVALLEIAYGQWLQSIYPHWSKALPLYN